MISKINLCNCCFTLRVEKKGRLGMRVKRKSSDGGIAIIKLYAIAAALSRKLCDLICLKNTTPTSCTEKPLKPGGYQCTLSLAISFPVRFKIILGLYITFLLF